MTAGPARLLDCGSGRHCLRRPIAMPSNGSMSVQSFRGLLGLVALEEVPPQLILDPCGVDAEVLDDVDGRLPRETCEQIATAFDEAVGDGRLVSAFKRMRPGDFGILDYLVRSASTLGEALQRLTAFQHLTLSLADCDLKAEGQLAHLTLVIHPDLGPALTRLVAQMWLASTIIMLRQMLGHGVLPVAMDCPGDGYSPGAKKALDELAGVELRFGQPAATIVLDRDLLKERVVSSDAGLSRVMHAYAERLVAELPSTETTSGRVRKLLGSILASGEPTLEGAARRLGMSVRTLQRRLRDEGTSFNQVLEDLRHELALVRLRNGDESAEEIALALGFSNASSFHRAFKRWTGRTPAEFRRAAGVG